MRSKPSPRSATQPRAFERAAGYGRLGFTLIELLVVIAIIAILVGILIPTIGAVRNAAHKTSTTAELGRIAAGINAYYTDFHAYPGPVSENDIDQGNLPTINGIALNVDYVTSSENLVLGLMGGLTATNTPSFSWKFDPTAVTKGPQSLNPLNLKQYGAYVDVTPDELSPMDSSGSYERFMTGGGVKDTVIPEFLDHIPGPILTPSDGGYTPNTDYQTGPILYMRARVGASGIVTTAAVPAAPQQYNLGQLLTYDVFDSSFSATDFPVVTPYVDPPTVYFANPNITGQPISKDSFILISAGIDRIYGTKDDIIYSN